MAKSGIIGYILISRALATGKKNCLVFFIFFNILNSLGVLAKRMPIANVNRIVYAN